MALLWHCYAGAGIRASIRCGPSSESVALDTRGKVSEFHRFLMRDRECFKCDRPNDDTSQWFLEFYENICVFQGIVDIGSEYNFINICPPMKYFRYEPVSGIGVF